MRRPRRPSGPQEFLLSLACARLVHVGARVWARDIPPPRQKSKIVRLLTLARDLKRRKARERRGLFVAEGVRSVEELVRSTLRIEGLLVAPQLSDAPRGTDLLAEA